MTPRRTPCPDRRRSRGVGLFDALVALAILGFGLLAMTRLQTRLVAQATEAQQRILAMQFGDELLSTALVDAGNAACYTLPLAGACGSATAKALADDWKVRALAGVPGATAATSTLNVATQRLQVTLNWTGKSTTDVHSLQMSTDVTP